MAKGSGGTRAKNSQQGDDGTRLTGGNRQVEITDDIRDYNLPQSVAARYDEIENIDTYNKLKDYLRKNGIECVAGFPELEQRGDEVMKNVKAMSNKIVTAVETYKTMFGSNALNALKRVVLADKTLDVTAAYHYNEIGENDPLAGTIRIQSFFSSGRDIFHELGHAMQDSIKRPNEDIVIASTRIINDIGMSDNIRAYSGAKAEHRDAERMAEALAKGFVFGGRDYDDFIYKLQKYLK